MYPSPKETLEQTSKRLQNNPTQEHTVGKPRIGGSSELELQMKIPKLDIWHFMVILYWISKRTDFKHTNKDVKQILISMAIRRIVVLTQPSIEDLMTKAIETNQTQNV